MKRPDARGECRRCIYPDYVAELEARLRAYEQTMAKIQRNASSWHRGDAAKGHALSVISTDAQECLVGGNTP